MRGHKARTRELKAQLTDELLESYVAWREACESAAATYARWGEAGAERRLAHDRYRAALQAEEDAAAGYRDAAARLVAGFSSCAPSAGARGGARGPARPSGGRSG
jgi:hypothetical protein